MSEGNGPFTQSKFFIQSCLRARKARTTFLFLALFDGASMNSDETTSNRSSGGGEDGSRKLVRKRKHR